MMKLRASRISASGACLAGMLLVLIPPEQLAAQCGALPDMILPSDGQEHDTFGISVALSADLLMIGAEGDDDHVCGAAYMFRHNGTDWIEEQQLVPDDEDCDYFGGFGAVAVSGDLAVVASLLAGGGFWDYGAAYVFRFDGSLWTQEQKLFSSEQTYNDIYFGMSVGVEGDTIILGAHWDT